MEGGWAALRCRRLRGDQLCKVAGSTRFTSCEILNRPENRSAIKKSVDWEDTPRPPCDELIFATCTDDRESDMEAFHRAAVTSLSDLADSLRYHNRTGRSFSFGGRWLKNGYFWTQYDDAAGRGLCLLPEVARLGNDAGSDEVGFLSPPESVGVKTVGMFTVLGHLAHCILSCSRLHPPVSYTLDGFCIMYASVSLQYASYSSGTGSYSLPKPTHSRNPRCAICKLNEVMEGIVHHMPLLSYIVVGGRIKTNNLTTPVQLSMACNRSL